MEKNNPKNLTQNHAEEASSWPCFVIENHKFAAISLWRDAENGQVLTAQQCDDLLRAQTIAWAPPDTAQELLDDAIRNITAHEKDRDSGGERSMQRTVAAFNAMTGSHLSVQQGWQFMQLLKMARSQVAYNADDFIDGAAYAALAGEAANQAQ